MKKYRVYVKSHNTALGFEADHIKEIVLLSGVFTAFYKGNIDEPITNENKVLSKNVTGLVATSEIIAIVDVTGSKL